MILVIIIGGLYLTAGYVVLGKHSGKLANKYEESQMAHILDYENKNWNEWD